MMNTSSEYRPLLSLKADRRTGTYTLNVNQDIMLENPESSSTRGESPPTPRLMGRKRWPSIIWFLLKIIGLYNYRRAVVRRPCYDCRLVAMQTRLRQQSGEPETARCGPYPGAGGSCDEDEEKEELLACLVDGNMNTVVGGDVPRTIVGDACHVCRSEWWDDQGRYRPYTETDIGESL